ncbi:MAG: hypothetical protein R3B13_25155 [Polyangiaceae bacterium]
MAGAAQSLSSQQPPFGSCGSEVLGPVAGAAAPADAEDGAEGTAVAEGAAPTDVPDSVGAGSAADGAAVVMGSREGTGDAVVGEAGGAASGEACLPHPKIDAGRSTRARARAKVVRTVSMVVRAVSVAVRVVSVVVRVVSVAVRVVSVAVRAVSVAVLMRHEGRANNYGPSVLRIGTPFAQ